MVKNKNKILLTGGAGFYGSHISQKILENNHDLIIVDILNSETTDKEEKKYNLNLLKNFSQNLESSIIFYECDITDEITLTSIFKDESPDIIIHAASLVRDRDSMIVPLEFIETNVKGTQILLDSANKLQNLKELIFISSRSAVGEVPGASAYMKESDHFRPINPYGATKAAAESLCHSFHHNTQIPLKICRMQPMYGPRCRPDMFVHRILNSIITGNKIQKYGTGEGVRDWLFVTDAAEALYKIMLHKTSFDIFNIGTGRGTSTNKLIELCEKITGKKANIENVKLPAGDAVFAGLADLELIKKRIDWKAKVDIEQGISITYDYMKNL